MIRLRAASEAEIRDATDNQDSLSGVLASRPIREIWRFDPEEYGAVSVVNPNRLRPAERVATAKATWRRQARDGEECAITALEKVAALERDLLHDGRFRLRPILKDKTAETTLENGRHRLVAAYACMTPIEVFWLLTRDDAARLLG
jgi:hypothetical protein